MLLLITGASGVGKSTVRALVEPDLAPMVECVELLQLTTPPTAMTRVWRQQTAETAVCGAIELQASGRHLLLCGDPVPAAEVAAAPSAPVKTARGEAVQAGFRAADSWARDRASALQGLPQVQAGGGRDRRRTPIANRVDDLAGIDALQVRARGTEVGGPSWRRMMFTAMPSRASSTACACLG